MSPYHSLGSSPGEWGIVDLYITSPCALHVCIHLNMTVIKNTQNFPSLSEETFLSLTCALRGSIPGRCTETHLAHFQVTEHHVHGDKVPYQTTESSEEIDNRWIRSFFFFIKGHLQ